jgi:hypothetical protein
LLTFIGEALRNALDNRTPDPVEKPIKSKPSITEQNTELTGAPV